MYAPERQREIVLHAQSIGRVSVTGLAHHFNVTPETIRRDLDALAEQGLLNRVHGGAIPPDRLRINETSLGSRAQISPTEKHSIAAKAIELLPHTESLTVLVDAGTTTGSLCNLLPDWVSTVVTNSVPSAGVLSLREDLDVILLGGNVRGVTQATVGAEAISSLENLRVDVAFMGTNGFSIDHGLSTPDPQEAAIKRTMVNAADMVYALADSSKWGIDHLVRFAGIDEIGTLITDDALPEQAVSALQAAGVNVEIASTISAD